MFFIFIFFTIVFAQEEPIIPGLEAEALCDKISTFRSSFKDGMMNMFLFKKGILSF